VMKNIDSGVTTEKWGLVTCN